MCLCRMEYRAVPKLCNIIRPQLQVMSKCKTSKDPCCMSVWFFYCSTSTFKKWDRQKCQGMFSQDIIMQMKLMYSLPVFTNPRLFNFKILSRCFFYQAIGTIVVWDDHPWFIQSDISVTNTEGNSVLHDIIVEELAQRSLERLSFN